MTAGFQLSLPGFDGPVEELPSVVSARQLALDDIQLSSIPSQFLAVTGEGDVDLDLAGEVLAATARLMLMKSAHLLAEPQEAEQDEPAGTREKDPGLLQPSQTLAQRQEATAYPSVGRVEMVPRSVGTRPVAGLIDAWRAMRARESEGQVRAVVPPFVRLEVAISQIISRLTGGARASLQRLLARSTREDVVMHFLATLELVRQGKIRAEQEDVFGEIQLGWSDDGRQRADRAG